MEGSLLSCKASMEAHAALFLAPVVWLLPLPLAFQITYQINVHFYPQHKFGFYYHTNMNCFTLYVSVRRTVERPVDMLKREAIE